MTPIYERTVLGTYLFLLMVIMAVFMASMMAFSDPEPGEGKPWFVLLILLIVPIITGVMKITVTAKELKLRFLLGLPRRTIAIEDIDAYHAIHGWKETGFGVSVKPSQGRYCAAGPNAVAIMLHSGQSVLIGTPEPRALVKAIRKARARAGVEEA